MNRLFNPFVGTNYSKGISGKKILVVGASSFCPHDWKDCFIYCTSREKKNSNDYCNCCSAPGYEGKSLRDTPSIEINNYLTEEESNSTYGKFAEFLSEVLPDIFGGMSQKDIWNSLAFTEYIQFVLPGQSSNTRWSDVSDRDYLAFIELIKEFKPDIVITWGTIVPQAISTQSNSNIEYLGNEKYCFHITVDNKVIAVIKTFHPCNYGWLFRNSNKEKFASFFQSELKK